MPSYILIHDSLPCYSWDAKRTTSFFGKHILYGYM
jgi:hypothetical protein